MITGTAVLLAGVDEVGRGCIAGPVYAAAVILPDGHGLEGLRDSKQLSAARREAVAPRIRERALAWAVASASLGEIERLNILQASLLAMQRAVSALRLSPAIVQVDGRHAPALDCRVETVVGGDATVPGIMAASILAKLERDAEMTRLDREFPGYGFAQHKGYGTPGHLSALRRLGPCAIHRRHFAPVAQLALMLETGDDQVPSPESRVP